MVQSWIVNAGVFSSFSFLFCLLFFPLICFLFLAIGFVLREHFLVVMVTVVVDGIPLPYKKQLTSEVIAVVLSEQCGFQKWRWKLNGIYVAKEQPWPSSPPGANRCQASPSTFNLHHRTSVNLRWFPGHLANSLEFLTLFFFNFARKLSNTVQRSSLSCQIAKYSQ